ncbi:hypothetical protein GCM10009785_04360 [Brooklawnia cerclae]|uniref:histidine kinase n=1 Tax=Brooklawnia cerclae TaxID=349934 RepID=A0ABX0SF88_9ACTN|nr:histidine kinase [Brooklawnia cerclae]NIH55973.1 signal transduction histidine kinase [Brooklawnia cerclae]
MRLGQRIATWFGTDDDFVRPPQRITRADVVLVVAFALIIAVNRELERPVTGAFLPDRPIWVEYLAIVTGAFLLLARRVWPTPVAALAFAHFFVTCTFIPEVGYTLLYQGICFFAIYSAAAWARDRRAGAVVLGAITIAMFGWVAWDVAVGSSLDSLREAVATGDEDLRPGILPPVVSMVLDTFLVNTLYVVGAIWLGRNAWWQARSQAVLAEQASTIAEQSAQLQRRAVTAERLRIARELHDVVAHHVSVMGIQAGAARTLLDKHPDQAREALSTIEDSSRTAVREMRGLLGALRGATEDAEPASRAPEPSLAELPALFAQITEASGLRIAYTEAIDEPEALTHVPLPLQLSLYRIVQEALTNVQRHSTAQQARVVIRAHGTRRPGGWVEAEVLDDGRSLPGTGGTGLGQMGIRERVASHGGTAEIGPRVTGGYRVRVRLPLAHEPEDCPLA